VGVEGRNVTAAMEPTGTYGDAIRYQLTRAGVPVRMVSPKRTHDSQELFDGVRSLHDPKSATLIAKLCAMGLSTPDSGAPPETRLRLRALVEQRQHEQRREEACFGRLEAIVARHWPELGRWVDLRTQRSALTLLTKYPSPAQVVKAPDEARAVLRSASRMRLSEEALAGVVADARTTLGVPMVAEEADYTRTLATHLLEAGRSMDALEARMADVAKDDEVFARLSTWMGVYTAAVIVTLVEPRQYATARQLEKACGLNLRVKSSGEHTGRSTITKRGPGLVRQVLYLFALRMIQASPAVRAWYRRRRGYTEESKQRAIVAVMRKLVRALFHVAKGEAFEEKKLFDLRRLDLETSTAASSEPLPPSAQTAARPQPLSPRTTPRPIARGRRRARAASTTVALA
jgi:transposase